MWERSALLNVARSPSGKAKVCKTFIGGSIPPRASSFFQPNSQPQLHRMCILHAMNLGCALYLQYSKNAQAGLPGPQKRHSKTGQGGLPGPQKQHSKTGQAGLPGPQKRHSKTGQAELPVLQKPTCRSSLHFISTASKLFVLLMRKGLILGC